MGKEFALEFENCRNIKRIDGGSLPLQYKRLNILFGSNGTGKTTISRVLDCWCDPSVPEKQAALESFTYQQSHNATDAPRVTGSTRKKQILVFNSEWVSDHCFRDDGNLQEGAYGLYVSSPEVRKYERQRKGYLSRLRSILYSQPVEELQRLTDAAAKGIGVSARGKVGTTFKDNAPLEGLPSVLGGIVHKMKDQDKTQWMRWHVQGAQHAQNIGEFCPYCGKDTSDIQQFIDFDSMHALRQGEAWSSAVDVFADGKIFRFTVNRRALRLMSGTKQPDSADQQWLIDTAKRAKALSGCLSNARNTIDSFGEDSSDRFFDELKSCLLTLQDERGFSDYVRSITREVASAIRRVLSNEAKIRTIVVDLEKKAADNAAKYEEEIDYVLEKCGYPYTIGIVNNLASRQSRVVLCPVATGDPLGQQPKRALSYGEQNTLALILFMFEAIAASGSCVVVLDDPISSFDGDKRFALLYRMFHNFKGGGAGTDRESLADKTVVLLTHDYLVVSDILNILSSQVKKPHVLRLVCKSDGVLTYQEVDREAVRPYVQMIRRRVKKSSDRDSFFQLVYLRCLCEMMRQSRSDKKTGAGCAFNLISLLVDDYDWSGALNCLDWDGVSARPYMLRTGENFIRKYIPSFDFKTTFDRLRDDAEICRLYGSVGITPYEKLQVLRLLLRQKKVADQGLIMGKYANEVYHLAGDYPLQLDPVDFNPVPPFVHDWCDSVFRGFAETLASASNP